MMGGIVGGVGCAVDGTMAAKNPISQLVDAVLDNRMANGAMRGAMAVGPAMSGQIDQLERGVTLSI
jgi:hypothetical protein